MGFYIIEINDKYKQVVLLSAEGELYCKDVAGLLPYTEPDMEQVRKEAYNNGHRDGLKVGYENLKAVECERIDKAYKRGLNDAWEAARKIVLPGDVSGIYLADLEEIFDRSSLQDVIKDYSASEAIEKLKAYEQGQEEQIQVGDEVIRHYKSEFAEGDDAPSIFLSEEDGYFRCLAFNGRSIMIAEYPKNQYRKTGRHFPEITEVLQKMKKS